MKDQVSFIKVVICVSIALALVVGFTFALISGIKSAWALVKYDGITIDEGGVNYLAAYYKTIYIRDMRIIGVNAADTEEFWQSKTPSGITYGEDFNKSFANYLRSVVAAASIYQSYSKYTKDDRKIVRQTSNDILRDCAEGSVDVFNEITEKYGFDYSDFQRTVGILYRAEHAIDAVYGKGGEGIKEKTELCEEYLEKYTHVSLLFVHLNNEMTEEELSAKQEIIDTLSMAIEAKNTKTDGAITEEMFENYLLNSDGDPAMFSSGYYFRRGAEKTKEFSESYPEILDASILMSVGDYKMVECSTGVCFIYKSDVKSGAYADESNPYFSDFYSSAASYHYAKLLSSTMSEVEFVGRYEKRNPSKIPIMNEFIIKGFGSAE